MECAMVSQCQAALAVMSTVCSDDNAFAVIGQSYFQGFARCNTTVPTTTTATTVTTVTNTTTATAATTTTTTAVKPEESNVVASSSSQYYLWALLALLLLAPLMAYIAYIKKKQRAREPANIYEGPGPAPPIVLQNGGSMYPVYPPGYLTQPVPPSSSFHTQRSHPGTAIVEEYGYDDISTTTTETDSSYTTSYWSGSEA